MTATNKPLTADAMMKQLNKAGVGITKMSRKGETYIARHSYFYTHGYSPEKFAAKIQEAMPGVTIVATRNEWAAWPKTSYFRVDFTAPGVTDVLAE